MQIALLFVIISPFTAYLPLIYMTYKWGVGKRQAQWSPPEISLMLVFLMSFISALVNQSLPSLVGSFGLLFFAGAASYFRQAFTEEEKVQNLLLRLWPIAAMAGIFGLLEKALSYVMDLTWFGSLFWSPNYVPNAENYRIYASFGNPNVAGTWFAWLLLLSIYLWETDVTKRKRYVGGMVIFSLAVIATGSRGATIAMLASLVVYGFISQNVKLRRALLALMGILVVLAILSPQVNHLVNNRTVWWVDSIHYILERPFTGWGIWGVMETIGNIHSHNTWLSILFFFGIPGLLVYMYWKIYLYKGLIRLHASGSKLAVLLIASQAYFVVHGMVDFTWMTPQGGALFFGLCGVTAGLMGKAKVSEPSKVMEGMVNSNMEDQHNG